MNILKLPLLHHSPLCPVTAVKKLLMLTPGDQDTPLFQIKTAKADWVPLTDTQTRCNFAQTLVRLGLQDSNMSLHTFRRSGASIAFNSKVSIQNTKHRNIYMCQSLLLVHFIKVLWALYCYVYSHTTVFRQSGELSHQRLEN